MNKSLISSSFRLIVAVLMFFVMMPVSAFSQGGGTVNDGYVSGTVVDATGYPVIGAAVLVKGTSQGASTDIDGKFSF